MNSSNLDLVQRAYRAFADRDLERLQALSHPEIEISTVTGVLVHRDDAYRGHEGVGRYLDDVARVWDRLELLPQEFHELEGERVMVFGRVRARRASTWIDSPSVWVWTIRDGLVASIQVLGDPEAGRALLGEAAGRDD